MDRIQDYEILEKIGETIGSLVYRGCKAGWKDTVVLKILKAHLPSPSEIARFKQEYEIIKSLDIDGVIKTYDIISHESGFVIVLEDFNGVSIESILNRKKVFDTKSFLNISIKISETIGELHKRSIIHKDIKPGNILINEQDARVKITDFGISSVLTHENEQIYNPDIIQRSLLYMSPEQTGRMNRVVDYRTDLYSLGVTFYKMLTGRVPFESKDPIEIIHSHIAREPAPPFEQKADIPKIISEIILKLMSKDADDRYQNSFGLMADLKECLEKLDTEGRITAFELARHDISSRFIIPQKLFGRDMELSILKSAFERVSGIAHKTDSGSVEVMLVLGSPGIGKSTLINEISKPVVKKKGFFISGNYEQFRRDKPYSAIIQAFQKLLKQVLTERDEHIEGVRKNILEALGPNAKVIMDIIPEVELIIGKQPDVPKLGPNETRNRFNIVFERFIGVFAKKEHPIVLFLDDLQWADLASLQFIRNLITSSIIRYTLIVGSYRDNEISASHPLTEIIKEIEKSGVKINRIILTELSVNNIKELIVNFLKCSEERGFQLAELIHKKTSGNPFFVKEFLQTLYNEKLLEPDEYFSWKWDLERIKHISITDNVVEFLSQKINGLPEMIKEVLRICACIGNRFDLETVSFLQDKSFEEILAVLNAAASGGFISMMGNIYTFIHDRIQEAAYRLLSEEEKPLIHYKIGKLVLEKTDFSDLQNKLFYIVDQLNLGSSLIIDKKELEELARMNCESGKKAKASGAYLPAMKYFENGMNFLGDKCWEDQYEFTLSIYIELIETAYLLGDFDKLDHYSSIVIDSAKNIYDTIPVYGIKIDANHLRLSFKSAIDIAIDVFKKLNYPIPEKPNNLQIKKALSNIKPYLSVEKIDSLLNLPEMTDPRMLAVSVILASIAKSASYVSPELFTFCPIKQMELSIEYGQCKAQIISYLRMANILANIVGDIEAGYKLGKLTQKLVKKYNAQNIEARTLGLFNLQVAHWKEHAKSVLPELERSYYISMETGDMEWVAQSIFIRDHFKIPLGYELTELEQQMSRNNKVIENLKQKNILNLHSVFWQTALNLLGRSESPVELTGTAVDSEKMMPVWETSNARPLLGVFYVWRLMLRYLFSDYRRAILDSDKSVEYHDSLTGSIHLRDNAFYSSLARLAVYPEASENEKKEYMRYVNQSLKKMMKWAKHAPMNNDHCIQIIEAEKARILGRNSSAETAFDRAIELSRKNEYLIEEAVANELAAKYYICIGKLKLARIYMQDAYACYARWGAAAKIKQLREMYPEILSQVRSAAVSALNTISSSASDVSSHIIDIGTVVKASQAISGEVELGKVLAKMIKIAIENAGAQKGFMILDNNGKYLIEAEGTIEDDEIKVLNSIPVEAHDGLSASIVNYAVRTKEILILNDASVEGDFVNDPYIQKNNPKSILCAPIINQGKLMGILYLENNLSTGAFTQERLEILNILSSQMAISIENAILYDKQKRAEEEIRQNYNNLKNLFSNTVDAMALAIEARDPYTAGHQRKVSDLGGAIAEELSLSDNTITGIRIAGMIHDLGKISIPSEILTKPGRLTNLEFSLIKNHSSSGYEILKPISFPWPIAQIVHQHHERIDGSGYPLGIKGNDILIESKIIAVADVVEAMASHRPYRVALGIDKALEEIQKNSGILYDPDVVEACISVFKIKEYKFKE